jgi:ABC-type arginine/histidine transport system permease subunit
MEWLLFFIYNTLINFREIAREASIYPILRNPLFMIFITVEEGMCAKQKSDLYQYG